jgi:hypothetical protein
LDRCQLAIRLQNRRRTPNPHPNSQLKAESYYRFLRAIHHNDRRRAELYAQKCWAEGLPETQLKELALLDVYQTKSRRGPEPTKKSALEKAMWAYIRQEGADEFLRMKKEQCAAHFKASPTTAWKVRNTIDS